MRTNITCCIDCPDRTVEPNCHSTCEKYLQAVEAHREQTKTIRDAKFADFYISRSIRRLSKKGQTR